MLLEDKVIIISGIGPGLGVKLAIEAAREGARVVIAARTRAKLDDAEVMERIRRTIERRINRDPALAGVAVTVRD